jgi:hypothetical protein
MSSQYKNKTIPDVVREMEEADVSGKTILSKYVSINLRKVINTIDAYINSQFIDGDADYMGREQPFFNIVKAARNIWYRATDLDRKNIRYFAGKDNQTVLAFIGTLLLQDWMRNSKFGLFLNKWGLTLATYGSAVSKWVEKDGELTPSVISWNNLLFDTVDFHNNLKVEILWYTPQQLKENETFDQSVVEYLCNNTEQRKTIEGQDIDNKSGYIKVYEVHGYLPIALLKEEPSEDDWKEYTNQIHIVSLKAGGKEADYTLYKGREAKCPYHLAHLIEEEGRTLSIGAVENLFDAQWMVNHSVMQMKNQLDLASKLLFQTSDGNLVGQNVLSNIENGDIIIHAINQPLTQLNNRPDIAAMQAYQAQWQALGAQINGVSESMMGANPPAGTAWRLYESQLRENHSLFELMTEQKGLYLEEIIREFINPYFKKQLNNGDEISVILDENQIKEIDEMYVSNAAKRRVEEIKKQTILSGQIYDPAQEGQQLANETELVQKALQPLKNNRILAPDKDTWKEEFKDFDFNNLIVDITGEVKDVQGSITTLMTALNIVANNPGVLQNPDAKLIISRILNLSGTISPLELKGSPAPAQIPLNPMPQMANQLV